MQDINRGIKCDVTECRHNENGCDCDVQEVYIHCQSGEENCTCCASYDAK